MPPKQQPTKEASPKEECFCCNTLTEITKLITCCVCNNKFNYSCVDLASADIKTLLKTGVSWTCPSCATLGTNINELKAILMDFNDDIESKLLTKLEVTSINDALFEDLIQEMSDRESRKHNIILYNVTECSNKDNFREYDKNVTCEILNTLSDDQDFSGIKPNRLGKFNQGKNRPIKITLPEVGSQTD